MARPSPCRRDFTTQGIRRYGFHGLSYEYIARRSAAEDPELGAGRVVVAHLGNGATMCAIEGGRSVDSTMGFTALDGLPMGTRSGQIDPGVILYLIDATGHDDGGGDEAALQRQSGLKGMSGVSQDMRQIEAAGTAAAEHALEHFAFRVRREIGAMAASIGGIDALVFTAGIGENAQGMRARICAGLEFLGITLDAARNAAKAAEISVAGAAVKVLVRRTDEEAMIAGHTLDVLRMGYAERPGRKYPRGHLVYLPGFDPGIRRARDAEPQKAGWSPAMTEWAVFLRQPCSATAPDTPSAPARCPATPPPSRPRTPSCRGR